MVKKNNENSNQNFDNEKQDPTKEAFFSDLMDKEEEFASEAYELVEHALNLIDSQFYDDGIEILRQAIGLYTQINREEEIKAVNEKISEVYLLKEKTFREVEIAPKEGEEIQAEIVIEDELKKAEQLIRSAKELEERKEFEAALDVYDEVENIFERLDKPDKIENLYNLIEDCYSKKAEFLRTIKEETPESKALVAEDELKEEKIQEFVAAKKREEEVTSQAYEILAQAAELVNAHEYERALKLYSEGLNLFKKINWSYEVQKIEDTIIELEKEKVEYFRNLEKQKIDKAQKIEIQMQQEEIIEQQLREREEQEKAAKLERLKELEILKMEEDYFKAQIGNMASAASKIARDYELAMQKCIKDGKLVEKCEYPQVIEIYKKIKKLLIEKGWDSETAIYDNTIEIYNQKLEQDKKVRQIEAEKAIKQKEAEEMLKIKKEDIEVSIEEKQLKTLDEEQPQREIEIQNLKKDLDDMINRSERLTREYEIALRQGRFELKCPYLEIIKIYEKTRQMVLERRMNAEAVIITSQINVYIKKMEKDKRLRQIEADKIEKQKKAAELLKVGKRGKSDTERLKNIERKKEQEEFRNYISGMIDKTEKIARDYELAKRKAYRKGEIIKNTPYLEVIEKYKQIRDQVQARGWNEQAKIYSNQIKIYQEKLEKHEKLFEVEAKKAQRQKDIEEMHKVKKVFKPEKLKEIGPEHKEENMLIDNAMSLINEAEKNVKSYELGLKTDILKRDILSYESPYEKAIANYEKAQELFRKIDWKNEAHRLNESINFYKEKKEKDDTLRDKEQKKFEQKKKEVDETASEIFNLIQDADHMAQEYELKIKAGIFDNEAPPYEKIIDIYREARKRFEKINWKEESTKLLDSIEFYKEKLEKDKKIRSLEAEKVKQREKELLIQQKLLEKARKEQEKLLKEKKKSLLLRKEQSAQFEAQK
ncbi:hypothetical protein LCGC14_0684810, partial [marine sediment metagenome]